MLTPTTFLELLQTNKPVPEGVRIPLVGRLFRYPKSTKGAIDLSQTLNLNVDRDDPANPIYKPYSFFMGEDGLQMLLHNGTTKVFETLLELGLTASYIQDQLEGKQNLFALIVLPESLGLSATWDGIFESLIRVNPELKPYADKYKEQCINTPNFCELEEFKRKYVDAETCERAHIMKDPTIFITPRRFLANTDKSFVDFRVMLWLWFSANQCFKGYGRTVDSQTGKLGVTECLVPNRPLHELLELHGGKIMELDVVLPK
eukprot:PhF_6_TR9128/c0_g1_i2/m.14200